MGRTQNNIEIPESTTQIVASTIEVPPHSIVTTQRSTTLAMENPATQTLPLWMNSQLQISSSLRANPQLQMLNAPLNTQAHEFQMSTTILSS